VGGSMPVTGGDERGWIAHDVVLRATPIRDG
jgi:hypothetical protein